MFTTITTVYLPTLLSRPTSRTIAYPNPDSDDAPSFLYICSCLVIVVEYTPVGKRLLFFSCGSRLLITHTAFCIYDCEELFRSAR